MTDAPDSPPAPCPADPADWARGFALRQLQMLGELAEIGLEVARAVERQASGRAAAPAAEAPACQGPAFQGDLGLAYARVSRAVRLTLMLQSRLIDGLKARDAEAQAARAEAADEAARSSPEYRRKARVERIVERLAEAEHPDAEDAVTDLLAEAGERLDDEDLYGDLMERPLSELVARLCRDLGLEPDWAGLAQELWAVREMEGGDVGRPLARRGCIATSPARGRGGVSSVEANGLASMPTAERSEELRVERARAELDAATSRLSNSS